MNCLFVWEGPRVEVIDVGDAPDYWLYPKIITDGTTHVIKFNRRTFRWDFCTEAFIYFEEGFGPLPDFQWAIDLLLKKKCDGGSHETNQR